MGDISEHIPKDSLTVRRIFKEYKKVGDAEPSRGYLGASIVGHPCERYLWYCFRQCCKGDTPGRIYRLFQTGDLEEGRMVADLRLIGCEVHEFEPPPDDFVEGWEGNPGGEVWREKQFEVSALGGHFMGHMDGCALGIPEAPETWHVLEFKTHNEKSSRKLIKDGVQAFKPQHFAQMQIYMHLTGMTRALYLAVNKNTDELYSERIRYDKKFCEDLMSKAERIITSNEPPKRAFPREDHYECNWCSARGICWGTHSPDPVLPVVLSCRQCCHATPNLNSDNASAGWDCKKHECPAEAFFEEECNDHLCLPGLFSFATPEDYGTDVNNHDFIVFKNEDGTSWRHGRDGDHFSSKELTKTSRNLLSNNMISGVKELFGATVTQHEAENILDRYPEGDCELIWKGSEKNLFLAWWEAFKDDLHIIETINRDVFPDYKAAELSNGRIAIVWCDGKAEIRKGKE